jgi:hypothetical protein
MRHSAVTQVNPILLLFIERLRKIHAHQCYLQSEHVGTYLVLSRIPVYSMCLCLAKLSQTRPRQEQDLTSTSRVVQMIIIILLSTNTLDLNLAIPKACELSKILS